MLLSKTLIQNCCPETLISLLILFVVERCSRKHDCPACCSFPFYAFTLFLGAVIEARLYYILLFLYISLILYFPAHVQREEFGIMVCVGYFNGLTPELTFSFLQAANFGQVRGGNTQRAALSSGSLWRIKHFYSRRSNIGGCTRLHLTLRVFACRIPAF